MAATVSQVSFNERVRVWKFVITHDSSVLWFPSCNHPGGSRQMCIFQQIYIHSGKKKGPINGTALTFFPSHPKLFPNLDSLLSALLFPSDVPKVHLCSENKSALNVLTFISPAGTSGMQMNGITTEWKTDQITTGVSVNKLGFQENPEQHVSEKKPFISS